MHPIIPLAALMPLAGLAHNLAPRAWDQPLQTCFVFPLADSQVMGNVAAKLPVANGTNVWIIAHYTNKTMEKAEANLNGSANAGPIGPKNFTEVASKDLPLDVPNPGMLAQFEECCGGPQNPIQFVDCFFWCKAPAGKTKTACADKEGQKPEYLGKESYLWVDEQTVVKNLTSASVAGSSTSERSIATEAVVRRDAPTIESRMMESRTCMWSPETAQDSANRLFAKMKGDSSMRASNGSLIFAAFLQNRGKEFDTIEPVRGNKLFGCCNGTTFSISSCLYYCLAPNGTATSCGAHKLGEPASQAFGVDGGDVALLQVVFPSTGSGTSPRLNLPVHIVLGAAVIVVGFIMG